MVRPDPYDAVILTLGAFRLTRLVGWDDLTIGLRGKLTGVPDAEHASFVDVYEEHVEAGTQMPPGARSRYYRSKLVRCPWCVGWWLSLGVYAAWRAKPRATLSASTPLALSAAVGLIAKHLDP